MVKFKPRFRGSFSDRNGIETISNLIQREEFDEITRNNIMNFIDDIIDEYIIATGQGYEFYDYIYTCIFQVTRDEIPFYSYDQYSNVRQPIYTGIKTLWRYDYILSFIEGLIKWIGYNSNSDVKAIEKSLNELFEYNCVGYRFIDNKATSIINEEEINSINTALNTKYDACSKCISKAIDKLYDRANPDYENSVKESISAIEGICNIINKTTNKTLGDALKEIDKNITIHPSLREAFKKVYGYTSDKNGIRHNGGIDEKTSFEEAQFMLVACSAFLNYLINIYEKQM